MNRKDLELLAKAIKSAKPECGAAGGGWIETAISVASLAGGPDAQKKFLERCGVKS